MAADFTPSRGNYKDLTPFRFWCQKVLPLVYDDSLSYYEVLSKMLDSLNMAMEDISTLNDDVTNLYTAYEQLQQWINAYYDSADFRQAIDDGLDRMVQDGTMTQMVDNKVASIINGVVAGQIGAVVADQIGGVVGQQIGAVVASQIGTTVAGQIGGVVADQIYNVVAGQIGNVVAGQIGGVVANQLPQEVAYQITNVVNNWLTANIQSSSVLDYSFSQENAGAIAREAGYLFNGIRPYKQVISATGKDYRRYNTEATRTGVYTDFDGHGNSAVWLKYTADDYEIPTYVPLTRNFFCTEVTQGGQPILTDNFADFALIGPPKINNGDQIQIQIIAYLGYPADVVFNSVKVYAAYTTDANSNINTAEIADLTTDVNDYGVATTVATIDIQSNYTITCIGLYLMLDSNSTYFSPTSNMCISVTKYEVSDVYSDNPLDWEELQFTKKPITGEGIYNLVHNRNSILYTDALANYATSSDLNDVNSKVGTLSSLTTTDKTDLVSAINELVGELASIGNLSNLTTTAKTNLVSAINEVDSHADSNTSNIGTLSNLTTTEKTNLVGAINEVDELVGQKADADGTYPLFTAGEAINILSTDRITSQAPYLMQAIPEGAGNREWPGIVGGSLGWNQLVTFDTGSGEYNGITGVKSSDGSITLTGTATGGQYYSNIGSTIHGINGHVIYIKGCPSGGTSNTYYLRDGYTAAKYDTGDGLILKKVNDNLVPQIVVEEGTAISGSLVFKPQFFDLTQMFGSTIADYVYTIESGTAGAGIAWLRKYGFFRKPYYAYNAGAVESVKGLTKHVTRCFNLWDEEWEVGAYNGGNGVKTDNSNAFRSKNKIEIMPDTEYCISCQQNFSSILCEYDANGDYLRWLLWGGTAKKVWTFQTGASAHYIAFSTTTFGATYNNDICVNVSDPDRNGEYLPYVPNSTHEYTLDPTVVIRGILKKGSNNELYFDGDEWLPDGTLKRKYAEVDLGTLTWDSYTGEHQRFYARITTIKQGSSLVCANLIPSSYSDMYNHVVDKSIACHPSANQIEVYDSAYSTSSDFTTAMNGVKLVYELATPTTEEATTYTSPQEIEPGGTESYVITTTADVEVPVGNNAEYAKDLKGELERIIPIIPDVPSSNGTYTLQLTVSGGTYTAEWISTQT